MPVTSFRFERKMLDTFIRFGQDLYVGDTNWIAPTAAAVRRLLQPEFELHRVPVNTYRCFLATSGGRVVGRAVGSVNEALRDETGQAVGTIGFFEVIDDYRVAEDLLDRVRTWLCSQRGIARIWGPMNFDIWHGYRLMTRGFDRFPFLGEPRNKPWYPEFFDRYGFRVKAEWDSVEVEGRDRLKAMIERGANRYRYLCERGYRFETLNLHAWDDEIRRLHDGMCRMFSGFLGFTPLSLGELIHLMNAGRAGLRPELVVFAYNPEGELSGFASAFVELGEAVAAMRGRTDFAARLRFLRKRKRADTVNFYLGGVTPEEIARRTGLGRAGFYRTIQNVLDAGYEKLLLTLRRKGNAAHALAARGAPEPQREYALFEVVV